MPFMLPLVVARTAVLRARRHVRLGLHRPQETESAPRARYAGLAWLRVGEPAPRDQFGSVTPTRPKPRRHSCASDPTGSARGFCGISASRVRSGSAHRVRRPDTPMSTPSIGLRGADLAPRSCLLERRQGVDNPQDGAHPERMKLSALFVPRSWRRRIWLGTFTLVTSAVFVIGAATASSAADGPHSVRLAASSKSHKHSTSHKHNKAKPRQSSGSPCLEGNWNVTAITLSTSGLSFTGGAGTTVDIMSNGNALGNFTPGTPLVGTEGSAKFNGTVTDHYGFSPKSTSLSGTFPVSTVTDDATITVAGVTRPVTSSPEQGSYSCSGKDLSLTLTSNGNTLTYHMSPAS